MTEPDFERTKKALDCFAFGIEIMREHGANDADIFSAMASILVHHVSPETYAIMYRYHEQHRERINNEC